MYEWHFIRRLMRRFYRKARLFPGTYTTRQGLGSRPVAARNSMTRLWLVIAVFVTPMIITIVRPAPEWWTALPYRR